MTAGVGTHEVNHPPARERVELIVNQLDQLPTLPAVAARLLTATTSDKSSAQDIVNIIESDTGLTSSVLKLVRGADLGIRAETVTVARVVKLMGFNAVRNLVLTIQLFEAFDRPGEEPRSVETRKGLWKHSLAVACTCELIGERIGGSSLGGEAFVCGLLHDIGKIALDTCLPKSYARVVDLVARQGSCICDVEREVIGLDHTIAGKRLVTRWRLPGSILECVWLHHQGSNALPPSLAHAQLVRIVHLADNLVRRQGIGYSGYQYISDVDEGAAKLGLEGTDVTRILKQLPKSMEPFSGFIDQDEQSSRTDYVESLMTANRRLGQLNAQLVESKQHLGIQATCFTALQQFTRNLDDHDSISDVCVASAKCVREMLGAKQAVAFFHEPPSSCVHVGWAGVDKEGEHGAIYDLDQTFESVQTRDELLSIPPGGFVAAARGYEVPWQRSTGSPPDHPLWILAIAGDGSAGGGVLVSVSRETMDRFRSAPDDCAALSAAMGRAVSAARTHAQADRMNEELLDLNRRLQVAQKELVQSRSVSMIASMAGGAAHELNNPLSVISGRAQMALTDCTDEESAKPLRIIVEQTQRASKIVMDLMQFAKPEPPSRVVGPLIELLEPLCQRWREGSPLGANGLKLSVADRSATVYADPSHFLAILDALLANAVEATKPETACVHVNSPSCASDVNTRIVVEDNGVGMTSEVLEHALDPFFSSRPAGRGRGLGLSRAFRLAEINGGRLWLDSAPNAGSTVTIELPARPPQE